MHKQNYYYQQGSTLIEILVSVVVIAVGMLGVAGMQINALKHTASAELRTVAINQANNIVERMAANMPGVKGNSYDNISGILTDPGCTSCTTSQIASRDGFEWNTNNALYLPNGQGTVVKSGNLFIITIRWDNDRTGSTGLGCSGNNAVDLTCYLLEVQL